MERYYQPEIECASREEIRAMQDERLVKQVQHVWDNVPYYRAKMEENGDLEAVDKTIENLNKTLNEKIAQAEAQAKAWLKEKQTERTAKAQ